MELFPESDIYNDENNLKIIRNKFNRNPAEMARRLLKFIIGKDRLSTMSLTGGNEWQPLPSDVYQTVYGIIESKQKF